jgi:hypothetical protein
MGCVPSIHFSPDFLTHLFEAVLVFHSFSACSCLPSLSLQKDDAFTHLSSLAPALCLLATHKAFPILPLFLLSG